MSNGLSAIKCEFVSLAARNKQRFTDYQRDGQTLDAMAALAKSEAYQDAATRLGIVGPAVPQNLKVNVPAELEAEFRSVFEDLHLNLSLLARRAQDVRSPEVQGLALWAEQTTLRAIYLMRRIMNIPQ